MKYKFFSVCALVMFFVLVTEAGKYLTSKHGKKYLVKGDNGIKLTWYEAVKSCDEENADLVTPNTLENENDIIEAIKMYGDLNTIWTSGREKDTTSDFYWTANGQNLTYSHWKSGEPVQHNLYNTHCIQMYEASAWISKPCTDKLAPTLCEDRQTLEGKSKDLELNLIETSYETELDGRRSFS